MKEYKECIVKLRYGMEVGYGQEIIRCKDCKKSEPWYGDKRRCFLWHEDGIDVFEDWFCNYGEPKDS